ncbi:class I SAM-dependent methyltransferase [Halomonas sp. I5-271120]|uniref:class I SAM-dependent methyltransferase n=1 Tax=Halomonas sp. I5-271120 TaxID=3061632 RepID=UPI002714B230|nr:methyltransferase domain-containing protein [Halomonas sp. I5-271120]
MSNSPDPILLAQMVRDARRYWSTEDGRAHWAAERACLGPVCERLFGAHSLELGMAPRLTDMCPINHAMQWSPTRELAEHPSTLVCTPNQLPLPDESLSLVVIHHLLEVVDEPHHVLQEAARVTADDGRLLIFGWSPQGVSGWSRLLPKRRRRLPWCGHWRTTGRLKDWLAFVDFEIERVDYCGFHWPGGAPRNAGLEALGRRYNLPLGDTFMIRARRRSQQATVQRPRLTLGSSLGAAGMGRATGLARQPDRMTEGD